MDLLESRKGGFHLEKSYSAAPFIVYRSAKYSGIRDRSIQVLATYGRFYLYLVEPLFSWFIGIRNLLYEIFGFLIILALSPLIIVNFIGLFLLRKFRIYLIRKYHKDVVVCEDLSPRSYRKCEAEGMVTFVLWAKGHIDTPSLQKSLETRILCPHGGNLSLLRKRLSSRYTLRTWEECPPSAPFSISHHVVQAPSKFYSCLITDDPHDLHGFGGKSDKSILQKYVTSRASVELDERLPPWQVTIIPLPSTSLGSTNKSRTCVVLRFHRFLMQQDDFVRMLVSSIGQQNDSLRFDLSDLMMITSKGFTSNQNELISGITANQNNNITTTNNNSRINSDHPSLVNNSQDNKCETEFDLLISEDRSKSILERIGVSLVKNYKSTLSDLSLWFALRKKQYQFHTKLALSKSISLEILENIQQIPNLPMWQHLSFHLQSVLETIRALSYIPFLICETLVKTNSPGGNYGFKWNGKRSTRHVSWSKPISGELVTEIQKKTDNSSIEAVVLMASSLALRDYYSENCISNPKTVGVTVTTSSKNIIGSYFNKSLDLPTRICDVSSEIRNLTSQLGGFPTYKQLGLSYLHKWSSYFLPRSMTYLVFRKIFQRYPLSFTFVDTESPFPNMSLWGQMIDEFTFSRSPQSDFCISITLVKYGGSLRLSVLSPMKSVDSVITRRFCQHLNQIAEAVGVPRTKIPYSRKSSPTSSSTSSPYQMRSQKSLDLSPLTSTQVVNTSRIPKRYNSCQSLLNLPRKS